MFVCCAKQSSVINSIYSGQQLISYTKHDSNKIFGRHFDCMPQNQLQNVYTTLPSIIVIVNSKICFCSGLIAQ